MQAWYWLFKWKRLIFKKCAKVCSYRWKLSLPVVKIGKLCTYPNVFIMANQIFFKYFREPDQYSFQVILVVTDGCPLKTNFIFLIVGNN